MKSTDDDVRKAVAACIDGLSFAVGSGKIAEVLTGSRAKWIEPAGAHELAVYGKVRMSRDDIRKIIHLMTKDGQLTDVGRPGRPVLQLSEAGRELLDAEPPSPEEPTIAEEKPIALEPSAMLESLIDRLMSADSDEAERIVAQLSYFRPLEVAKRLMKRFDASTDGRTRARAVWALGELAESAGLTFLMARAKDADAKLRALAAAALGKIARAAARSAAELPAALKKAQQTVLGLMADADASVKSAAQKALAAFLKGG
jgi:hypothetical protein